MWSDMIRASGSQHPTATFYAKHSSIVVSPRTIVHFNDDIIRGIGHYGSLMIPAGERTLPDILNPAGTTTDILHIHASILNDQQIFEDSASPLLRLFMYTGIQDEQVETVLSRVSQCSLQTGMRKDSRYSKIKITDEQGESIKSQNEKVLLTLHSKQKS